MSPRNLKDIAKGLDISRFEIIEYSVRSESGHMIELRYQPYYVPVLSEYLSIILPKGICKSEGYNGTLIAHFRDEHDSYAELDFKEDKPGWHKVKPVERVYIK